MSGESRLRHVAAMNPAGRGSISTEEARVVCAELDAARARLAALEAVAEAGRELAATIPASVDYIGPITQRFLAALRGDGVTDETEALQQWVDASVPSEMHG